MVQSAPDGRPVQRSGSVAAAAAPKDTCRDFMKGRCSRERCKFVHDPSGAAQTQAARVPPVGSPPARSLSRPGPAQTSPEPHDGVPLPSLSSQLSPPVAAPSSASCSSASSSSSTPSPAPSSAPTSPKPRRPRRNRFSDDDREDSPPGSLDNSPRPAGTRSRSWSADEMPHPGSPRSVWQKPLYRRTEVRPGQKAAPRTGLNAAGLNLSASIARAPAAACSAS
jgi:hypothetical protein